MGITLPGWADEALDIIGVSWPNVDEDDYREMAEAMREFAETVDKGAADAAKLLSDVIGNSEGGAVDALSAHWSTVKGTHLANLAEAGRLTGTALDAVAVLIEGAKIAAIVQLGVLAAEIAASVAAAPFTLGLSTLGGLAGTAATRTAVKRILSEVCEQIASQIVTTAMGPVFEALGSMAGDLAIQAAGNAMGGQGDKQAGDMQLLSAAGPSGGGSGKFSIDLDAFDDASSKLKSIGAELGSSSDHSLGRARSAHGRTRGKDALADAANAGLDTVSDGIQKGAKRMATHLDDVMPRGLKKMATNHRENDRDTALSLDEIGKSRGSTPVYHHSDNRNVTRLGNDGQKHPLDENDKKRLGILRLNADDTTDPRPRGKLGLPKKKKGEARPQKDSTQVALGSTDLSRAAQLARHSDKSYGTYAKDKDGNQQFSSNNYAAVRFGQKGADDEFILAGRSRFPVHSERVLGIPSIQSGATHKISELYTEREPCTTGPNCSAWMSEHMPKEVQVSHSVEYGTSKESQLRGNQEMQNYLDDLRKKGK
ncbi:nucleic acid/nucleotide deaminase domain-containing protein [Streptomyces sp. NPDC006422]|uniref:nucleic acid/nucleotide deaminase domain-containing protein n=1 Tax=unclassified Streptomyces TaxID=2593676 RepID=UPI0033B14E4E